MKGLFARPASLVSAEPDPDGALWAVGDVHGWLALAQAIEARVRARDPVATIVFLGDVIDRGPDSRGMIDWLLSPPPPGITRRCLLGNHEDMALRFLARPAEAAAWLRFGGGETLASYGVTVEAGEDPRALASAFAAALPEEHRAFLAGLPVGLAMGRYVLTHAGAAAEVPLARQNRAQLVWERHAAIADLLPPRDLGDRFVVHGHVPVPGPLRSGWRINVDTGAYASGRLTAVRLPRDGEPEFIDATM